MDTYYLSENEEKELLKLEMNFIKSYIKYKDSMNLKEWLNFEIGNNLPQKSKEEINNITKEIIDTIELNDKNKESLENSIRDGRSKESWFASNVKSALSYMNIKEYGNTLKQLDDIIQSNNKSMIDAITTKSGNINKNPNLDGFIAEQLHVNSFNRDSVLKGSNYRAEALVPKAGQTYGKNSVDVVVRGNKNNIIQRYQVKYGKTAEDTINMIKKGNYNNQRLVVPHGQVEAVKKAFPGKTVVSEIEFNNIKSESLSKLQAKDIQEKSQSSNNILLEDWNSFNTKDLATKIGTDIGKTALYGMAIGAGFYVADKIINEEEIEMKELVKVSLQTGSDAGMKAAISSAIKVGAEKEIIKCIPKGTPASTISNIVYIGVENAKIVKRVYDGELTLWRGIDEIEKTTISIGVGIIGSNVGSTIGGTIGSILGPGGTMVGAFIGGTVGYMAGSEVGNSIAKGYQKTRRYLCEKIIETTESIKDLYSYNVNSYATLKA